MTTPTTRPSASRPSASRPAGITVLYDANCPICRRARKWVEGHRVLVPVRFVAAASATAIARFPALDVGSTLDDVTVVTDEGAVFRGDQGWIVVLWAVAATRPRAYGLANGRHRVAFRAARSATSTIRELASTRRDSAGPAAGASGWPPPAVAHPRTCATCGH